MKAEAILSIMLGVGSPGGSPYSAVPEVEGTELVCDTMWSKGCRRETREEALPRWWTIARATAEVTGRDHWLSKAVLVVTYHESGSWRRDVHSGEGKFARGDQGRSWGLGQKMLGVTHEDGPKLVGLDYASTERSIAQTAADLRRARNICRKGWLAHPPGFECVVAAYGGVWSRGHRLVMLRVGSWGSLPGPTKLAPAVLELLGLKPEDEPEANS